MVILTSAGFRLLGGWTRDPEAPCGSTPRLPVPGVYAFVVDDVVVYVGLTKSGLHRRFEQYRRGHKRQRTSARINDRIASTLADKRVTVLMARMRSMLGSSGIRSGENHKLNRHTPSAVRTHGIR
jgi:hypothetical protein